ncbi:MAG TPA: glycerophosphodiester phosphodiesterase family protein [Roseivirga sp.]
MKQLLTANFSALTLALFILVGCTPPESKKEAKNYVKVVAHRGDWKNAPENSFMGLKNCIDMGVDMIEIDLAMTKDSVLVLMHDETLDRTTNGKGPIREWTLDALQALNLTLSDGTLTSEKIPTFEDFLLQSKGKIEVFIDKGYPFLEQAHSILEKTGTLNEGHFLGFVSANQFKQDYPELHQVVNYMPLVLPSEQVNQQLQSFEQIGSTYYLYSFDREDATLLSTIDGISTQAFAMATTQEARYCAGHTDSLSLSDPEQGWGWVLDQGFNAICTDFPEQLISYLKSKNRR